MFSKKILILFSTLTLVFFAFLAHAQTQTNDIVLTINPQYPKADANVTASLSSYSTDLDKANISWTLNGQLALQAVGQKNFSFTVGDAGTQTILAVQIQASDGSFINKDITITPADIDMLWEAEDAYTPPFYEGKTIAPSEGMIKVVTLPASNTGNGENYVYNWKQDGNAEADSSGYGKNSYSFKNSYLEPSNTVEATVSDLYGNSIGDGQITITPGTPKILFYEKDPTLGTEWQQALADGFTINPNGETLVAEPYFFTPKDLTSSNLQFTWSLGGSPINTPTVPNELSIKPASGQSGSSTIELSINNIKTLFLSMDKTLNVNF
jgi:hypothetical protein